MAAGAGWDGMLCEVGRAEAWELDPRGLGVDESTCGEITWDCYFEFMILFKNIFLRKEICYQQNVS